MGVRDNAVDTGLSSRRELRSLNLRRRTIEAEEITLANERLAQRLDRVHPVVARQRRSRKNPQVFRDTLTLSGKRVVARVFAIGDTLTLEIEHRKGRHAVDLDIHTAANALGCAPALLDPRCTGVSPQIQQEAWRQLALRCKPVAPDQPRPTKQLPRHRRRQVDDLVAVASAMATAAVDAALGFRDLVNDNLHIAPASLEPCEADPRLLWHRGCPAEGDW